MKRWDMTVPETADRLHVYVAAVSGPHVETGWAAVAVDETNIPRYISQRVESFNLYRCWLGAIRTVSEFSMTSKSRMVIHTTNRIFLTQISYDRLKVLKKKRWRDEDGDLIKEKDIYAVILQAWENQNMVIFHENKDHKWIVAAQILAREAANGRI